MQFIVKSLTFSLDYSHTSPHMYSGLDEDDEFSLSFHQATSEEEQPSNLYDCSSPSLSTGNIYSDQVAHTSQARSGIMPTDMTYENQPSTSKGENRKQKFKKEKKGPMELDHRSVAHQTHWRPNLHECNTRENLDKISQQVDNLQLPMLEKALSVSIKGKKDKKKNKEKPHS